MKKLLAVLALVVLWNCPVRAEAVVTLPEVVETTIYAWQAIQIPVYISDFTNPTGLGARWLECNVIASPGLTIEQPLQIGPWTISGNPNGYYGWHNYYVDNWQMVASWINDNATRLPGCITQTGGLAFSIRVYRNQQWSGHETLTFGRSIKENGPEPRLIDCANNLIPIHYGNTVCVVQFPEGSGGEEEGGCCQEPPVTTTLEGNVVGDTKTGLRPVGARQSTWGRLKALYR